MAMETFPPTNPSFNHTVDSDAALTQEAEQFDGDRLCPQCGHELTARRQDDARELGERCLRTVAQSDESPGQVALLEARDERPLISFREEPRKHVYDSFGRRMAISLDPEDIAYTTPMIFDDAGVVHLSEESN